MIMNRYKKKTHKNALHCADSSVEPAGKNKKPEQQQMSYWTLIVTNLLYPSMRTSCFGKR